MSKASPRKSAKLKAYDAGLRAEKLAALILKLKGYRILKTRYKTPVGEIDIIAAKGKMLIAVEVKKRTTRSAALESISAQAKHRITRAMSYFISVADQKMSYSEYYIRFDVMAFPSGWFSAFRVIHLDNAWRPPT